MQLELTAAEMDRAYWDFCEGFRSSRKGNMWRDWQGMTLTIFQARHGKWTWCIADGNGRRWGRKCDSQESAMSDLFIEVGGVS
jgi:hypothetical protein